MEILGADAAIAVVIDALERYAGDEQTSHF
jgi:hypothetical protein